MGEFKQLLPYGDKAFVVRCVDNLLAAAVDEVLVVTGHRDSDVRQALADYKVKIVFNPNYREGMSTSIQAGVRAVAENAQAMLIALADQPQIGTRIVNQVIEAFERTSLPIVIPAYNHKRGHPIILHARLKDEILAITPGIGLKEVVQAHAAEILYVEVADEAVLMDFDYPEDYRRLGG